MKVPAFTWWFPLALLVIDCGAINSCHRKGTNTPHSEDSVYVLNVDIIAIVYYREVSCSN